jgi:uncharacterized NAD-dependent epimerase/dehydratase family protein
VGTSRLVAKETTTIYLGFTSKDDGQNY